MATTKPVFIFIGTYPSEAAAQADYDVVKDLHAVGGVGTFDAAGSPRTTTARCMSTRTRRPPGTAGGAARRWAV